MGNAPDVIGRGSDSAPYFYAFFNQRHDAHLENRYTHNKTSHLTKPRSNPLIYNWIRNKKKSPQNGKSFGWDWFFNRLRNVFSSAEVDFPNGATVVLSYIFYRIEPLPS